MKNEYLECGRIVGVHGVHGACKVESWCDTPGVIVKLKHVFTASKEGGYEKRSILGAFVNGALAVVTLDGIDSREGAVAMKNTVLYIHRSQITLKEGEIFVADMIGLPVKDATTGQIYGSVAEVNDGVQGRLYTVDTPKGQVIYPSVGGFVSSCTLEEGLLVNPIPGFFD